METVFQTKQLKITLVDVGGQRSERRKWLQCFDGVDMVLFIVAISEYDETLSEDNTVNRMQESLRVFGEVCDSKWFPAAQILLFLNKKDVFEEKIIYSPVTQCFRDYNGGTSIEKASEYIKTQFQAQNRSGRELYCHYTNAKDATVVNVVFKVMVDNIITGNKEALFLS